MNGFMANTYWIAIAHLPKWNIEKINRLIIAVTHENKMLWEDFFDSGKEKWKEIYPLSEKELADLEQVKNDIPRLSFIAEQLHNEGFQIIPINSPDYPGILKENLRTKSSPPVLYIKGRKGLLQEDSVAIVGSRKAGEKALEFTDHIAKKCVKESKNVVSGFAKGVDRQALDSTIEAGGKSIIVLPQGILTFQSGFKQYYEPIVNGEVLVLSSFFPKAGWDAGLAMARNTYIYGMAKEIYVAESNNKGGTWEGAIDGLKRQRKIYVRIPDPYEKTANLKLIELGAVGINMEGETVELSNAKVENMFELITESMETVNEPIHLYGIENIENQILNLLKKGSYTQEEILLALKLNIDTRKLTAMLQNNPRVKANKGNPAKYSLNEEPPPSLFE